MLPGTEGEQTQYLADMMRTTLVGWGVHAGALTDEELAALAGLVLEDAGMCEGDESDAAPSGGAVCLGPASRCPGCASRFREAATEGVRALHERVRTGP
ncbi:hypothetical protein ACFW17_21885 [Streptomyces sp. NPDC058961]|uniref:hypothetical protein n=1 Tax=Streptomyces sp. NPDC058961 TaxID=3346680 RepID=UPI003689D2A1